MYIHDISFDEWSHKLAAFAVQIFGRFVIEGDKFVKQAAASVWGRKDGGSIARKGGGEGTPVANRLGDHRSRRCAEGATFRAPA